MKCKQGDLAIIIDDIHPSNIGAFVRVLKVQDELDKSAVVTYWKVFSKHPLVCLRKGKQARRKHVISNDCDLSPIKGLEIYKFPKMKTAFFAMKSVNTEPSWTLPFQSQKYGEMYLIFVQKESKLLTT